MKDKELRVFLKTIISATKNNEWAKVIVLSEKEIEKMDMKEVVEHLNKEGYQFLINKNEDTWASKGIDPINTSLGIKKE